MQPTLSFLLCATCMFAPQAYAQDGGNPLSEDDRFALGQIVVTAPRSEGIGIGIDGEALSSEAIYKFNRTSLDDAVNLMPGVVAGNSGGTRNERLVFVRGFDRFQVPLSIDGIRVYLPADNRLDYGRFLTTDISEVQVAKGYASVLDGPGAMGGAINLVTRRPTKALDIDVRGTVNFDNDVDMPVIRHPRLSAHDRTAGTRRRAMRGASPTIGTCRKVSRRSFRHLKMAVNAISPAPAIGAST